MPYGSVDMHYLAQCEALELGPRPFNIRGSERMAYGLNKKELKKLFYEKKYNVTKRSRWRGCIAEWIDPDLHGDTVTVNPKIVADVNEDQDWSVIFIHIAPEAMLKLQMAAEDTGLKPFPTKEMWDSVCGY